LASGRNLTNVEWRSGDVYALPFADEAFDVVTCRFALHHFENPRKALAEMARVCRPGGRVALCDAVAPADAAKAFAFNAMERHRDPSTVAFRPLSYLVDLFPAAGLQVASVIRFQVAYEAERLVAKSFPANDDRDSLRHMISELIASDAMELGTNASATKFIYPAAVLTAVRPDGGGCRRT
jgi:ubiquinone/menaquinone biosynthesis C-methylase UbiE